MIIQLDEVVLSISWPQIKITPDGEKSYFLTMEEAQAVVESLQLLLAEMTRKAGNSWTIKEEK